MKLAFLGAWLVASAAFAADVSFQGTFNTSYKNNRPNEVAGSGTPKAPDDQGNVVWEGSLQTNWNGKIETFKGTITNSKAGDVKGDFFLMLGSKPGRHFVFAGTAEGATVKAKIVELVAGGKQVPSGDLTLKQVAGK